MVITKISPLSILRHLRVVNSAFLKQRFDDCLFQVSFYQYNFFINYNHFYQSLYTHTHTHTHTHTYIYICSTSMNMNNVPPL